jgi:hypothetical protein
MPVMTFIGKWSEGFQEGVQRGLWAVKPDSVYVKPFSTVLKKLKEWQHKTGELRELKITVEYHYRKRNLDQNALMWSLYSIEANEQNAGMSSGKNDITAEELYEHDLQEYAPKAVIECQAETVRMLKNTYRIWGEEPAENGVRVTIIKTSSQFDTREMAEWINRIFNRLADSGVHLQDSGAIQGYWSEWRKSLGENKITLNDTPMSQENYKSLNPICEGCGKYIVNDGDLSHINAKGMGGNPEKEKQNPSNWLHLCREDHSLWHSKGWEAFIKKYEHLKYKVLTALKRNYEEE